MVTLQRQIADQAPAAHPCIGDAPAERLRESFPAWFWDVDNDGVLDLYVSAYIAGIEHLAADAPGLPTDVDTGRPGYDGRDADRIAASVASGTSRGVTLSQDRFSSCPETRSIIC